LEPVTAKEATAFLGAAASTDPRWGRVLAHLHAHPHGDLAAALSSPLMVALAHTIYTTPGHDPGELMDLTQAGGRTTIEQHLLDGFIPAAYNDLPIAPGEPRPSRRRSWNPALARHWLTVLAAHLDRVGTRDFTWWQLPHPLPRHLARLAIGLVFGLVFGLPVGLAVGRVAGLGFGLVIGLLAGLTGWLRFRLIVVQRGTHPERVDVRIRGRLRYLLPMLPVGFVIGLVAGYLIHAVLGVIGGVVFGLMIGLMTVLANWLGSPVEDGDAVTPRSVLRGDRALTIVRALPIGLTVGVMAGAAGGLVIGLMGGLAAVLALGPISSWYSYTVARGGLRLVASCHGH
jgi:hypothetical protein